jgi:hypothetical protein
VAETPPAWVSDALRRLGAHPIPLDELVSGLRRDHPDLTADQVVDRLGDHPHVHAVAAGWVNLVAAADGVILTHLLMEHEKVRGALDADGDLDLWARMTAEPLPFAGGGVVRRQWQDEDTVTGASVALVGPAGWLDAYEPGRLLGLRLRAGALELSPVTVPESDTDSEALDEIAEYAFTCASLGLRGYLQWREGEPDEFGLDYDEVGAAMPIGWVVANLVTNRPEALRSLAPPLTYLLTAVTGLDVDGSWVRLPGIPADPAEAAELTADELMAQVRAATFVRICNAGDQPADKDCAEILELAVDEDARHYLADLVECDGLPEDTLERLRAAARTPSQRAAATLLAARSAEGDHEPAAAERLLAEALRQDPELEPALMDAAEYAVTRGDLVAAEGFYKRAGLPRTDPQRMALARLLAPPAGRTGRNQPCPCGSGRKYKLCCLPRETHPLANRASLAYHKLAWWMLRAPQREEVEALADLAEDGHPQPFPFALDLATFDTGLLDEFLGARGDLLPPDERALIERWQDAKIEPYEVARVREGVGVTLRPLLGAEPVELRDRALAGSVRRLDLVVARILHDGERPCLFSPPSLVPRMRRYQLLAVFEDYAPEALAAFFGPQPLPALTNRDGHELVLSEATYQVPAPAAAWRRLAERLEPHEDDPDLLTLFGTDEQLEVVHRGSVRRDGGQWLVEANSVERLRELQKLVRAAAPEARLVEESTEPVQQALTERRSGPSAGEVPPEAAEAMAEFIQGYEERWLDEPVPALGGKTPRQAAAAGGQPLAELRALLDDLEWQGNEFMDAHRLRVALGLS